MKSFIKMVVVIDAVLFLIIGLFSGIFSDLKFGVGLIGGGLILILFGAMSVFGGMEITPGERINMRRNELDKSYDFCLLMTAAAILPLAIGYLMS